MLFKDRRAGGQQLAEKLRAYKEQPGAIVLGLPRGGVVTGAAVAEALGLPLDIVVPRKIGAPDEEELAIGAITEAGEPILDDTLVEILDVPKEHLAKTIAKEKAEAERRLKKYRGTRPPLNLTNQTAIIVDDGVATGATMRAGIASAKAKGAIKIVVATPVIAADTLQKIRQEANEVIYLDAPENFSAVGQFYTTFPQTTDEEVVGLLAKTL